MTSDIDVIMLTWNSNRPFFKLVLEHIKRYVPMRKFIVVDRYSKDGTPELIKIYFPKAEIIKTNANLARARKIGIEAADSEIIAFIDDDVFIREKWYPVLYSLMKLFPLIGMIYPLYGLRRLNERAYEFAYRDVSIKELVLRGLSAIRGRTIATMVRRTLVLDWEPSKELSAFEDYHLTQHILNKGALVVQVNEPLAIHVPGINFSVRKQFEKSAWNGAGMRVTGAMNLIEVGAYSLARIVQGLMPEQQKRLKYAGFRNNLEYIVAQSGYIIGWLFPRRYLVLKR
jgi:glycosyltransferase involved in cell wall biosynthesis